MVRCCFHWLFKIIELMYILGKVRFPHGVRMGMMIGQRRVRASLNGLKIGRNPKLIFNIPRSSILPLGTPDPNFYVRFREFINRILFFRYYISFFPQSITRTVILLINFLLKYYTFYIIIINHRDHYPSFDSERIILTLLYLTSNQKGLPYRQTYWETDDRIAFHNMWKSSAYKNH